LPYRQAGRKRIKFGLRFGGSWRAAEALDFRVISGLFFIPMPRPPGLSAGAAGGLEPAAADEQPQFVVGPENALVRVLVQAASAQRVAQNPLVLCGPGGVGKTTLAHLLAEQRRAALGLAHVVKCTGADVARGLADAAETNSVADFRKRHHRADLLVIDDLHELAGKAAAQEYLTAALDVLIQRGVLVIAALRQLPSANGGLAGALASRLSAGLVVPLAPPETLARKEILRGLARQFDLLLTEELAGCLAGGNGRWNGAMTVPRLRHVVMQVAALAQHSRQPLRPALVARVLAAEQADDKTTLRQIAAAVARHFQLPLSELKGKSRQQHIAEARGAAMHLCRELLGSSYAQIGRFFGGRDHTTVLHACRKVRRRLERSGDEARMFQELTLQISTDEVRR
jgi:chromosomal replication initiator protein